MGLLEAKIQFYQSMATLYDAGIPIVKSLQQQHSYRLRSTCREIADGINQGIGSLSELMQFYPGLFNFFETQLIKVGEKTGRLDNAFLIIARWLEFQKDLRSQLLSGMLYPLLLYHCLALFCPAISWLTGQRSLTGAGIQAVAILLPLYLLIVGFLVARKLRISLGTIGDRLILALPIVGNICRKLDYSRFFLSYSFALEAGLPITDAIRLAAATCRNRQLQAQFNKLADTIDQNQCPFVEAFLSNFSPGPQETLIISLMETGEVSGKADETAERLANLFRGEAETSLRRISKIVPKLIYRALVFYLAFTIIGFWSKLFQRTSQLGP